MSLLHQLLEHLISSCLPAVQHPHDVPGPLPVHAGHVPVKPAVGGQVKERHAGGQGVPGVSFRTAEEGGRIPSLLPHLDTVVDVEAQVVAGDGGVGGYGQLPDQADLHEGGHGPK